MDCFNPILQMKKWAYKRLVCSELQKIAYSNLSDPKLYVHCAIISKVVIISSAYFIPEKNKLKSLLKDRTLLHIFNWIACSQGWESLGKAFMGHVNQTKDCVKPLALKTTQDCKCITKPECSDTCLERQCGIVFYSVGFLRGPPPAPK